MTLGDKLTKLRKENNYTQEQLANILGVSRQSVSKWESDIAYPETEKLLKIGEIYNCSMDYLLKDNQENASPKSEIFTLSFDLNARSFERKSKRSVCGLPLWHINIGLGRRAKGVVAIGFSATGIISIGLFSFGVISVGLCSLGILALGVLALGLLSVGAFSVGIIAGGAICLGILSFGAIAIGDFSLGALAIGKYFALGDHAQALIALGDTKAIGSAYEKTGAISAQDIIEIKQLLDINVPPYLFWAKELFKIFL